MKRFIPAAAALALVVSCAPPFNLDYSSAAVILGRMTKESELGPLPNYYLGSSSDNPRFYPDRTATGVDCTRGFLYTTDAGSSVPIIGFVQPNGQGGWSMFTELTANAYSTLPTPPSNQTLYHADPNYQRYIVAPIRTGDYVSVIDLDSIYPANRSIIELSVPAATQNFTEYDFDFFKDLVGYGSPPVAAGFWVPPSQVTPMPVYFLMRDTSLNVYHDANGSLNSAVFAIYSDLYSTPPLPFLPVDARVNYFHDPASNTSYASFYSGGSWQFWKWTYDSVTLLLSSTQQLTGVTSRIDALLTNGEFFSAQDGVGRVYDSNGNKKASFPLGKLSFAYEEYVNSSPRVFFSMPLTQKNDRLSIAVYSIATSDLDTLSF